MGGGCVREHRVDACDYLVGEDSSIIETDTELIQRGDDFLIRLATLQHDSILVLSHCEFIEFIQSLGIHC
jgi:hypothetical protein